MQCTLCGRSDVVPHGEDLAKATSSVIKSKRINMKVKWGVIGPGGISDRRHCRG